VQRVPQGKVIVTKDTRHGKAPRLTPRALLQALEQDVTARGLVLTREAYARERQGQVLCGVLDIYGRPIGAWGCAVAVRYAPEERLALRLAPGLRLREGGHLLCTGDLVLLTRQQLARRDLAAVLARGMDRCLASYAAAGPQVERLRQTTLTLADAQARMEAVWTALQTAFFCDDMGDAAEVIHARVTEAGPPGYVRVPGVRAGRDTISHVSPILFDTSPPPEAGLVWEGVTLASARAPVVLYWDESLTHGV
jgi:hypothetical protein